MKCPIQFAKIVGDKGDEFVTGDCIRDKCAWWDKTLKCCAVTRIANRLDQVTYFLGFMQQRRQKAKGK